MIINGSLLFSYETVTGADFWVGFRVVMQVIVRAAPQVDGRVYETKTKIRLCRYEDWLHRDGSKY